ncbi:MAG: hypothetical protein P4L40_23010, partial [Terracidiphilus sp.]|nr:hypothetical protein [Terracidiphilus sp.]
ACFPTLAAKNKDAARVGHPVSVAGMRWEQQVLRFAYPMIAGANTGPLRRFAQNDTVVGG